MTPVAARLERVETAPLVIRDGIASIRVVRKGDQSSAAADRVVWGLAPFDPALMGQGFFGYEGNTI